MPTFALDHTPQTVIRLLQRMIDAPLPRRLKVCILSFGSVLEPRYIIRARPLDQ